MKFAIAAIAFIAAVSVRTAVAASCADQSMQIVIACMGGDLNKAAYCRQQAENTPCRQDIEVGPTQPAAGQNGPCGQGNIAGFLDTVSRPGVLPTLREADRHRRLTKV
jgi:hypothetical protein